jgi:hypothetical protein
MGKGEVVYVLENADGCDVNFNFFWDAARRKGVAPLNDEHG